MLQIEGSLYLYIHTASHKMVFHHSDFHNVLFKWGTREFGKWETSQYMSNVFCNFSTEPAHCSSGVQGRNQHIFNACTRIKHDLLLFNG